MTLLSSGLHSRPPDECWESGIQASGDKAAPVWSPETSGQFADTLKLLLLVAGSPR